MQMMSHEQHISGGAPCSVVVLVVVVVVVATVVGVAVVVVIAEVAVVLAETVIVHGTLGTQRLYFLRASCSELVIKSRRGPGSPFIVTITRYWFVLSCRPCLDLGTTVTSTAT